jgi:hypothetical protein
VVSRKTFTPTAAAKAAAALTWSQPRRTDTAQAADVGAGDWERARQRNAIERDYEYLPPNPVIQESKITDTAGTIACDVELCRIALGLRQAAQMRLWLVLVQYARDTGYNHITRRDFMKLLDKYEIAYNVPNFHRWLRQGDNLYWNLDSDRVWLIGYKRLSIALVDKVLTMPKPKRGSDPINLVLTNNPGYFRHIYIKVASKSLIEFEAACYSGWLTAKNDPTISRYSLSHLFRRHPNILRRWEKIAKVKILNTFAHYTEETSNFIPQLPEGGHRGDVIEYAVKGRKRWSVEYSNTYQPQPTRQHDKRGQCLTVSRILHKKLESLRSAGPTAQIPYRDGRLHRGGRKIFQDAKSAKSYANIKNPKEQYIMRGVDNRQCLHLECSPDGVGRTRLAECSKASVVLEMQ